MLFLDRGMPVTMAASSRDVAAEEHALGKCQNVLSSGPEGLRRPSLSQNGEPNPP